MTRLALVGADANRAGRRAPAGSDTAETSAPVVTARLVPIWSARSFGSRNRGVCTNFSPETDDSNSSPAKSRGASRNAQRSIGSLGNGERAVVVPIRVDDGGPDGEAA